MATLNQLLPGQSATIRQVLGQGLIQQRLLELGFLERVPVRAVRVAPLGDPMEVEIHGYHLAIRKSEAALVEISESGQA